MFSIFKKKVQISKYTTTMMNTIFYVETTGHCLKLKKIDIFKKVTDDHLLDELRSAHIQLLSVAVTKNYFDIYLSMEMNKSIKDHLERNGNSNLLNTIEEYTKAFGSSPIDGVQEMAKLIIKRLNLDEDVSQIFKELFYEFLSSLFADIAKVKLVV